MRGPYPVTNTSDSSTVTAAAANLATMLAGAAYLFVSSTDTWVKQGTSYLVTCVAKASFADTDYITIAIANGLTKVYEFDTAGNGVTAGRVQVNISAATTAASVAAILRTAILANQPSLEVTDNTDGTLTIVAPSKLLTITKNVANAGFLAAINVLIATAADGCMFVPAKFPVLLSGDMGPQLGVLRDSVDGKASLTRVRVE